MLQTCRRIALPGALILILGLAACGEKAPPPSLLDHVPADTPYVIASSEPLPRPLYERLLAISEGNLQRTLQSGREMAELIARQRAEQEGQPAPETPDIDAATRVLEALATELEGKFNAAGMAELGLGPDTDSVIYGLSLFPVVRTEVTEAAKVEALLQRIEQRSGTAPRVQHNGASLRRIPLGDRLALIVALRDKQLILGVLPVADEQAMLPVLLGESVPDNSLAKAGTLAELRKRYGYGGYADGYVDSRAVARAFTGEGGNAHDAAWQRLMGDAPRPSPACINLIDKLTTGVPRLTAGLTSVSDGGYEMTAVYETVPAVSAHLQRLAKPKPLPGMGVPGDKLLAFGMDMDMAALREAVKTLMRFVAREGQGCDKVDPAAIEASLPKVDLMLGPMTGGLSGLYTELTEFRFDPETGQPAAVRGGVLLAVQDPRSVLALAAMMNPALAQLDLPLDGTAVAAPADLVPPPVAPLYLAAREGLLAMAVGKDAAARAPALLDAASATGPLLLGANYDMARLLTPMLQAMNMAADQLEAAGEPEQAQSLRDQAAGMESTSGQFGRIDLSLAPDAAGLVMKQRVELR